MYVYFKSISSAQNFVSMGNVNYFSVGVIGAPINILQVYIGGLPYNFAWTPALNTWYHLVVKRDGSNSLSATATDAALGDVQLGSPQNCSANISISAIGLNVGTNSGANGNFFNGYMDDLRVCSPVCTS